MVPKDRPYVVIQGQSGLVMGRLSTKMGGRDCGIDLVYEDVEGKHWAIQSKCVSPDREISKAVGSEK